MSQPYITIGCPTSGGGQVITGCSTFTAGGVAVALVGDQATCPLHKCVATIVSGDPNFNVMGKAVARINDTLSCGCHLLAQQTTFHRGSSGGMGFPNNVPPQTSQNFKENDQPSKLGIKKVRIEGGGMFVPLGVPDVNGKNSSKAFSIDVQVESGSFDRIVIETVIDSKVHKILEQSGSYAVGTHSFAWDGFIGDVYDSKRMTDTGVHLVVKGFEGSTEKGNANYTAKFKYNIRDWLDVKIDKAQKHIDITMRVNFDYAVNGLQQGHKVPLSKQTKGAPISTQTVSESELCTHALKGIGMYWSRVKTNNKGKNIHIGSEAYEVKTTAVVSESHAMPKMKLIFNTNDYYGRSSNAPTIRKTFFNVGYLDVSDWGIVDGFKKAWEYFYLEYALLEFEETIAHEMGHELLLAYDGRWHSYTHKGSSHIWQQPKHGTTNGKDEIDLMRYAAEKYKPADFYDRVVAAETDVGGLIWITGLN